MIFQNDRLINALPYPLPTSAPLEKIAFLDLETSAYGRKNSKITYLGLCFYQNDGWYTRQWITEAPEDEFAMLSEAASLLSSYSCLVHYNGNSFDLPVLKKRCQALHISLDLSRMESLDLFRSFTPLKKLLSLTHLTEQSLEQFLGLSRRSMKDNDLAMLPRLLPLLSYLDLLNGNFTVLKAVQKEGENNRPVLTVNASLFHPVPNEFSLHLENGYLSCQKTEFQFLAYGIRDTLKYFYPDYKNYYYLPMEDIALHKSVASYVDKEHRRPAAASTCYTRKSGCFLPEKSPRLLPAFQKEYKDGKWYLALDEKFLENKDLIRDYIVDSLPGG